MREQNIALIQGLYEAFGRGDIAGILEKLASDVDWKFEGPSTVPFAGHQHNPQGVLSGFFQPLGTTLKDHELTIDESFADGDHVITLGRFAATVVATGARFTTPVAHVWTVRDGRVTRFVDFNDTAAMASAYTASAAAA